jgi:hypothetical protein
VWGSSLDQGRAQGEMLGPTIKTFIDETWQYLEGQVEEVLKHVPLWLAKLITDLGLDAALDFTETVTRLYTPTEFYDSIRGMCETSGTNYQKVISVVLFLSLLSNGL